MSSWLRGECAVLLHRDVLSNVSEVVIAHIAGMNVMDADVHVQAGLDVIYWRILIFEVECCLA